MLTKTALLPPYHFSRQVVSASPCVVSASPPPPPPPWTPWRLPRRGTPDTQKPADHRSVWHQPGFKMFKMDSKRSKLLMIYFYFWINYYPCTANIQNKRKLKDRTTSFTISSFSLFRALFFERLSPSCSFFPLSFSWISFVPFLCLWFFGCHHHYSIVVQINGTGPMKHG